MVAVANKVRKFREALGLSYEELARRLHCSVRSIKYVESGMMTRFSLAAELADALGRSVEDVFPALRKPLRSLSGGAYLDRRNNDLDRQFENAGIDPDPQLHTVRFVLRNGLERYIALASAECSRLRRNLQAPSAIFVCFETATERIALNVKHLVVWQFITEFSPGPELSDDDSGNDQLAIWVGTAKEPKLVNVEPDIMEFGTEAADDVAVLQTLFFQLGHCWEDDEVFYVDDDEGDTTYFRADNVSMLSVPLQVISPAFWTALNEN